MAEAIGVNTFGNTSSSLSNIIYDALVNGNTNIHYLTHGGYTTFTPEINLFYIETTGHYNGQASSAWSISGYIGITPLWLYIPTAPKDTGIIVPGGTITISSSSNRINYKDTTYFTMTCTILMLTV